MTAETNSAPALGQRHVQVFLLFTLIVVNFVAKFSVGVSVVAMTNAETTNPDFKEYDWDDMERSYIYSSFFWGYVVTQFPGGYLCRRFGTKKTMLFGTLGSAVFSLLPPLCVDWGGWQVYCAIRVMQGLFQGPLFPALHAHLAAWCPVSERNRLGALANTGIECGTVLAMFLSGIIAASSLGWPGIFYMSGIIGIVWCVFWMLFGADSPKTSKFISETEFNYIENSKNALKETEGEKNQKRIPVPWAAILTSLPFWALLIARSAQSWGFSTLQTEMAAYMNGVLSMDMKSNALFSALPYLAMWCMSYVYLISSDILLSKKILSLTAIRKTFNSLAFWIPAASLIGVGFFGVDQKTYAIVLMTTAVGINSGSTIGSALNTIDLSPNHAGILMGIVNTSANVVPILTPLLVGVIVSDTTDRAQWQIVFIISAIVFTLGNLFYVVFGRMKVQPWDAENFLALRDAEKVELAIEKKPETSPRFKFSWNILKIC